MNTPDTGTRSGLPRVLIVSTNADLAGAPAHVRDLVLSLRDRYAFTVVFGEDGPIRDTLADQGIATRILPGMRSAITPLTDLRTIGQLLGIIRDVKPAVVHAHSTKAGLVARVAGRLAGVPVAYSVHGWGFGPGRPRLQSIFVRASERLLAPVTQAFLSVSATDAATGRRALGLTERTLHLVRNGVPDTDARADPGRQADFVMVARTDYAKNHQMALEAFSRTAGRAGVETRFTCVGGGTDDPAFIRDARRWAGDAAPRLDLLGARADIPDLLSRHGVFVLSSRYEGLPLSIIEAMRSGLPVIATRVGGVPELVIDGETGLLVGPDDVGAMADAMRRLASDSALRSRLGAAGRQRFVEHFTVERMRQRIAGVYDALIAAGASLPAAGPISKAG